MGQNMTNDNGVILLAHALTVGLTLFVLINSFAKYSGAHFNPAVTIAFFILKKIKANEAIKYIFAQIVGAFLAVIIVNTMYGKELIELSSNVRSGNNIYVSEILATFGLVLIILLNLKEKKKSLLLVLGFIFFLQYGSHLQPVLQIQQLHLVEYLQTHLQVLIFLQLIFLF